MTLPLLIDALLSGAVDGWVGKHAVVNIIIFTKQNI